MIYTPRSFDGATKSILHQFGIGIGATGASDVDLLALYGLSQTVYTCANIRAENVAAVRMQVVDERGKPVPDHWLSPVFAPTSNYKDVAKRTELCMFFVGANVNVPQINAFNRFLPWNDNLRWINPRIWSRKIGLYGLEGFYIARSQEYYDMPADLPLDQAIYFQGIDLLNDFDAVAPAEVAYNAGMAQSETWQTIKSAMENRAIPATILQPTQDSAGAFRSNPDMPKALTGILERLFGGSRNAGKTMVSPDRLEAVKIQQEIEKMAIEVLAPEQRKAITEAAQVPDVLVAFSGATFENADAAVQFWYRNWLKPYCGALAQGYTRFFSRWSGEQVIVAPDFSGIIQEDDDTDRVNAQVTAGYRDLFSAQQAIGLNPDERLRGVYMWNGTPTHIETLVPEPARPAMPDNVLPMATYIPQDVFKEIEIAARKGLAFTAKVLPAHTTEYILALVNADIERPDLIAAAKAFYTGAVAAKAIQATRLLFEMDYEDLLIAARNDAVRRKIFGRELMGLIEKYTDMAYRDGLMDGGVADASMTDEDMDALNAVIIDQRQYVKTFAAKVYSEDGLSDAQALGKPEQWFNGSILPTYYKGLASAAKNGYFEWVMNPEKENCRSCIALNGQIHRMGDYTKANYLPNSERLICGAGKKCGCKLVPRPGEKAKGRFPTATKEAHEHASA